MQDNLNFIVKDNYLTELQLDKLKKLLEGLGINVLYEKRDNAYSLDLSWDSSAIYRRSSRYAGRNKIHTDLDWNQVEHLKALGLTNEEISEHLGVNIRTFYRRKNDHKNDDASSI